MLLKILAQSALTFAATLCFSFIFNIGRRYLLFSALGGGLTWLVYSLVAVSGGHLTSYFVAAMFAAVYSEIMSRVLKTPVTTFVICSVIPLVPGGGMYNAMMQIVQGHYDSSLATGIDTLSIAGVIAVGIIFVSSVVRIVLYRRKKHA
ncbi:MAG: threonine/serine exporter family protein [Clostridia bacterium]|nr:threonine/serine exporter family protein [Clostridia bacterium]MDR3645707.1 threonine/serine exporter family protein [Clostridia bacterium]